MSNNSPQDLRVLLGTQLVDHLKSLRKLRGLTQAELGQLLGLSQARVAIMEARPGSLTLDQLLRLLNALGADMLIRARPPREMPGLTKAKRLITPVDKAPREAASGRAAEAVRQPRVKPRETERVSRSSATKKSTSGKVAPDKLTGFAVKLPKNKGSW